MFCKACLGVLKFQWIPPTYAIQTERRLHAILPLASSSILSRELFNFWEDQNIYPYAFGVFLYFGIALSANTISSYCKPERNAIDPIHSITKLDGCILTCTLLVCPVLMYIYLVFSEENVSFSFTMERVCSDRNQFCERIIVYFFDINSFVKLMSNCEHIRIILAAETGSATGDILNYVNIPWGNDGDKIGDDSDGDDGNDGDKIVVEVVFIK